MESRDGLHEMRGGMVAEVGADVSDAQTPVGSQRLRVGEIFVTEGHLDGAQQTVLTGDVFTLQKPGTIQCASENQGGTIGAHHSLTFFHHEKYPRHSSKHVTCS